MVWSKQGHGGLTGVPDRDDLIEAADLEDFLDVVPHRTQDELPLTRFEVLRNDEEHSHAGAADEFQTAKIDDQVLFAVADVVRDDRFERVCVRAVKTSDRQQHQGTRCLVLLRLQYSYIYTSSFLGLGSMPYRLFPMPT